jgi:hypothetical protein
MTDVTKKSVGVSFNTSLFYPKSNGTMAGVGAMDPTMGYSDAGRLNSVFTNVEWIKVLGDEMYNEFKTFNLCLTSVTSCNAVGQSPYGTDYFNFGVVVCGVGLPWLNSYNEYSRSDTGSAVLTSFNTKSNATDLFVKHVNTFRRPPPISDFHIKLYKAGDGLQVPKGAFNQPAAYVYSFEIYGVERA